MHLRPAVRRLTVSWITAIVIVATMTVGMAYNARQVVGVCWLGVVALSVYALSVLRRLRPLPRLDGLAERHCEGLSRSWRQRCVDQIGSFPGGVTSYPADGLARRMAST
jgi:hypothetical protein